MQNGKLNNSQRKALVGLVENAFNRRIENQRELCSDAIARITNDVKAELGVTDIEEQLQVHESLIKELEAEKEKLGFSKYRNESAMPGSEARRLIDKRAADEKQKITELESEMDRTISAIWTAVELSEVKPMVNEILGDI